VTPEFRTGQHVQVIEPGELVGVKGQIEKKARNGDYVVRLETGVVVALAEAGLCAIPAAKNVS